MLYDKAQHGKAFKIYNDELLPLKDEQDYVLGQLEDVSDIPIARVKVLRIGQSCSRVEQRYKTFAGLSARGALPTASPKLEARVHAMEAAITTIEDTIAALERRLKALEQQPRPQPQPQPQGSDAGGVRRRKKPAPDPPADRD